jgi:glycosyltransferase involved in cell wall biosynthesis
MSYDEPAMDSRISIVVPSKGCQLLKYLLNSLSKQTLKHLIEVIIVTKDCKTENVEHLCSKLGLKAIIIEQKRGFAPHAYNIGIKEARGDLVLFTDDDAIPHRKWVELYFKIFSNHHYIACISSRDIYLDLKRFITLPTPDDMLFNRCYRWFIRLWLEQPHPKLTKYKLGVYITKNYTVAHGPFIPNRSCLSLAFRGVNMAFKGEYIREIRLPEHPLLKRALLFEQFIGLKIISKGGISIYIPYNPIFHIMRESLSRTPSKNERVLEDINQEINTMKYFLKEVIDGIKVEDDGERL